MRQSLGSARLHSLITGISSVDITPRVELSGDRTIDDIRRFWDGHRLKSYNETNS